MQIQSKTEHGPPLQHLSLPGGPEIPPPYRLFFPLGIVLGLLGVSVWPIYWLGWGVAPSAAGHVGLQIQGFVLSFALGFLLTAVPKFVGAPPVGLRVQLVLAGLVLLSAVGFWLDTQRVAQGSFVLAILTLVLVVGRRVRGGLAPPPEPFVAVLLGLGAGLTGGLILLGASLRLVEPSLILLGRRLLSEGMILAFVVGIGGKIVPLLLGHPTRTPRAALTHGGAALVMLGALVAQYGFGWDWAGWVLAAAVVPVAAWNARLWRLPATRSALSWGVWISHWLLAAGLLWSAATKTYRVEALHLVFVGGFSILILSIGMRVTLAHGGHPLSWEVRSWPLRIGIALFLLATLTRVGAKFSPDNYLMHLGLAGLIWMCGLAVWGAVLVRRIVVSGRGSGPGHVPPAPGGAARARGPGAA